MYLLDKSINNEIKINPYELISFLTDTTLTGGCDKYIITSQKSLATMAVLHNCGPIKIVHLRVITTDVNIKITGFEISIAGAPKPDTAGTEIKAFNLR